MFYGAGSFFKHALPTYRIYFQDNNFLVIWGFTLLSTLYQSYHDEETSTYSWSMFCTVNCRTSVSNYQLFPHKVRGLNRQPQRWEVSVLPLYHCGPPQAGQDHEPIHVDMTTQNSVNSTLGVLARYHFVIKYPVNV